MTWIVVETYYKRGDYRLFVFDDDSSLKNYLYEQIRYYGIEKNIEEDITSPDILYLIDLVETHGTLRVENEEGWGVREIREI